MQKVLTASMSLLLFAQSFSVSLADLFHIPDLVIHYEYHQETFGDDLFSFIEKHYGELKEEHKQEHEGHDKLPFGHSHSCAHTALVFLDLQAQHTESKIVPVDQTDSNFAYRNSYYFTRISGIFQPPKNA